MNIFTAVKWIVRAYFAAALYFSFTHITTAWRNLGADTPEGVTATLMVDGFFVLGAIMRGTMFSARTRQIGLRVQIGAGAVSVAANVFAATSAFGVIFGAALPLFVVFTEWMADARQMKSAQTEAAELAVAEAERVAAEAAAEAEAERLERNAKARAARAARRDAQAKANAAETRRVRKAAKALETAV
jgi:hypothetical protein